MLSWSREASHTCQHYFIWQQLLNLQPLSDRKLVPVQTRAFRSASVQLLSWVDLGIGVLWAVVSFAWHPTRLCSGMSGQMQLPRASWSPYLFRIRTVWKWNGKLHLWCRRLSPNPGSGSWAEVWRSLYYGDISLQERVCIILITVDNTIVTVFCYISKPSKYTRFC